MLAAEKITVFCGTLAERRNQSGTLKQLGTGSQMKVLRYIGPFLLFFVLPLVAVFWKMGGFATVSIDYAQRGPYYYAYLENTGDLGKLIDTQGKVYDALKADKIEPSMPISLLLNNPMDVKRSQRLGQAGYVIPPGTLVRTPLLTATIPARRVLLVQVEASPMIAPSKAYTALIDYLNAHHMALHLPTVEVYHNGVFYLEMGV